ncbi:hypothetical protein JF544_18280 [Halobacillus kuroshimensis]|uniref:Uncharacterized protein n=1 Tax=Halobacillus kuroshimensis TaxID=302481 RepID=A0ABS3E0T7_9BACI|nr:hypothetical protein [Halobacillus kuroshimensis]MBN8237197.1 hypothetical protein [Halobacillus kuroshimensis]
MSEVFLFIMVTLSMVIWVAVSREAVKTLKEINRWKMQTLLSAGSLSTLFITLRFFKA